MTKRGQIALWTIIAIVIVAFIALIFIFNPNTIIPSQNSQDPVSFINKCVRSQITEALDIMLPHGGFIAPTNFKRYRYTDVEYLCENTGYFKPCINQHPLLLREMQQEIKSYTQPRIEHCFDTLQEELMSNNYEVTQGSLEYAVQLGPDRVYVDINKSFTLIKGGETKTFTSFPVEVISPAYDLAQVANIIANEEAQYCYTEYVGYMLLYPRFDIEKFTLSESTRIYTITDKYSQKSMNIAIRGCAIPPGL